MCLDCIYVDGLHVSLSQRALNATPQFMEKLTRVKHMIFQEKHENNQENCLSEVSQWVTLFQGWRPFGHLWRPKPFLDTESASKMLEK